MNKLMSDMTLEDLKGLFEKVHKQFRNVSVDDPDIATLHTIYDAVKHFTPLDFQARIMVQNMVSDYFSHVDIAEDFKTFKKLYPTIVVNFEVL